MTVATEFYNYQAINPATSPLFAKGVSPNLRQSLEPFVLANWQGQNLGDYGVRPIRSGTSMSTHGFGAAWDWRYENPGPGRAFAEATCLPFLIGNSLELGVDVIHDYLACRIWHAGRGWLAQTPNPANGMGQSWARYFHIEIHPSAWFDARPVETKLANTHPEADMIAHEQRMLDTRDLNQPLAAGEIRRVPVMYGGTAAMLNLTVIPAAGAGFLTVWDDREPSPPNTSNVNWSGTAPVANAAFVGTNGGWVKVRATAACHLVIDLQGYQP